MSEVLVWSKCVKTVERDSNKENGMESTDCRDYKRLWINNNVNTDSMINSWGFSPRKIEFFSKMPQIITLNFGST